MHCSLYGFEPYLFHNKLPLRVCPVYSHLAGLSYIRRLRAIVKLTPQEVEQADFLTPLHKTGIPQILPSQLYLSKVSSLRYLRLV